MHLSAAHGSQCVPSASVQSMRRNWVTAKRFRSDPPQLTSLLARQAKAGRRPAGAARQARVGGGDGGGAG